MADIEVTVPNPAGPRVQRREAWVNLPDAYAGFRMRIWVNAPSRIWDQISSEERATIVNGLQAVILEHNGWLDFDGEPYPPPSAPSFWDAIPTELLGVMITAAQIELGKLPKSMAPQRRR